MISGAGYHGCYLDDVSDRDLTVWPFTNDNDLTIEKCVSRCRADVGFSGLEVLNLGKVIL